MRHEDCERLVHVGPGTPAGERGERARGSDAASYRSIRLHDGLVPAGSDWRAVFAEELTAKW